MSLSVAVDIRARRLYLAARRQDLLAPVHSLMELTAALLDDPALAACEPARRDVATIRAATEALRGLLTRVMQADPDVDAQAERRASELNHDIRGRLAVIIGYGQDLARRAPKLGLQSIRPELQQLHDLGGRCLALLDEVVAHLRGRDEADAALAEVVGLVDDLDAAPAGPAVEPGRILVADDNADVAEALRRSLVNLGHEVTLAADGEEALRRIEAQAPDLVLLDIFMPRLNGVQVLSRMKAAFATRDVPVIMISGLDDLGGVARCITMGAEDFLPKPCNDVLLRARVGSCLEKKRLRDRNEQQRRRYDELLHAILPAEVVAELAACGTVTPRRHDDAAVLFADIVGFTPYCDRFGNSPEIIVGDLQRLFEEWEEIAARHNVQKIKTIGDAFMAAGGLLGEPAESPVLDCVRCGLEMIAVTRRMPTGWDLRVGVHVGPVVAGVLGRRQYLYDLWGDTVNTAARLESHGVPGCVNLSETTWPRVCGRVEGESRGRVEIKGKGPMDVIHLPVDSARILPA